MEMILKARAWSDCHHALTKLQEGTTTDDGQVAAEEEKEGEGEGEEERRRRLCLERTPLCLKDRVEKGQVLPSVEELVLPPHDDDEGVDSEDIDDDDDDSEEKEAREKRKQMVVVKAAINLVIHGDLAQELFLELMEYMDVAMNWADSQHHHHQQQQQEEQEEQQEEEEGSGNNNSAAGEEDA